MNEELRCYTFTDFMLSSIQQGIQSGHASMELVYKYMVVEGWQNGFAEQVNEWIKNHKTIICLNGGNFANLHDIKEFLDVAENPFPFSAFEEEEDQGGNLTSVAIILPARIFDGAQALRSYKRNDSVGVSWDPLSRELHITYNLNTPDMYGVVFNEWERDLMERLNRMPLAT